VNVVAYLKQKGVDHGDIRPYNVLLTFDGVVKIGEVYMHSKSLSGYSQLLNHSLEELYISP
jgi:serine/threonine protein kinase